MRARVINFHMCVLLLDDFYCILYYTFLHTLLHAVHAVLDALRRARERAAAYMRVAARV